MESAIHIQHDNPLAEDSSALILAHLAAMAPTAPPESRHALPVARLAERDVVFLTARNDAGELMGCGAMKRLDAQHAEIKSMKTADAFLRRGVATEILQALMAIAREKGITRLSLETGSMAFFDNAHRLYERHGFVRCAPFGDYRKIPIAFS